MKSLLMAIAIAVIFGLPAHAKKGPKPVITADGKNALKKSFAEVQSCQPTLTWSKWFESPASVHDIAIYAAFKSKATGGSEVGELVYSQENISGNSFRVAQKLKPKTRYFWTFRQRIGGKPGPWATQSYSSGGSSSFGYPFDFKTPKECL